MKAKKFNSFNELKENGFKPGSYMLFENENFPIFIVLPCGHQFRPDKKWEMSHLDNSEKITLLPSIFCYGTDDKPCWHGYLVDGEFNKV